MGVHVLNEQSYRHIWKVVGTPGVGSGKGCRYHGAHKPNMVKRGAYHPRYRQGREALEAKGERSRGLAELWDLAALSFALELATGPRWRGRKPIFEKACK